MYNNAHEYEVACELAWRNYINACEDITIPMYKVVQYRDEYDRVLNTCICKCEVCDA